MSPKAPCKAPLKAPFKVRPPSCTPYCAPETAPLVTLPGAPHNGVIGLLEGRLKGYLKGSGAAPSMRSFLVANPELEGKKYTPKVFQL